MRTNGISELQDFAKWVNLDDEDSRKINALKKKCFQVLKTQKTEISYKKDLEGAGKFCVNWKDTEFRK